MDQATIENEDLKTIATITTLQEAVINRMVKYAMSMCPAKQHKEFRATLESWISDMPPGDLFAFTAEFSRANQKKQVDMGRALYKNFVMKKEQEKKNASAPV